MKTVYMCNAPEDHAKAAQLKRHLTMLLRNELIKLVDDVASADLVLILLSNDMLLHEKTWADSETAKRRYKAGQCRLLPILVEPMTELPEHLAMLVCLPRHGKPVNGDGDWAAIAGDIRAVAMIGVV